MRDYKEIVAVVGDLERSFPVASLSYADIPLWPILRQEIANSLFWEQPSPQRSKRAAVLRWMPAPLARLALAGAQRKAASSCRRKITAPVTALFATAGFEYTPFNGEQYNKFLDPVKELLDARMVTHADIELGFDGRDYSPKRFPTVDLRREVAIVSRAAAMGTPGFSGAQRKALTAFLRSCVTRQNLVLDGGSVIARAARVSALAEFFAVVLGAARPRACFYVCNYQDTTMALAHASRKMGVKTVELQHSVVAEHDWNWCQWSAVPPNGYTTLPDFFWAWGKKYADFLSCWQRRPGTNLSPRVGGNLWIWKWRRSMGAELPKHTADLAGAAKTVLYTVPFGDAALMPEWFPPELEQAMRASPADWRWHVRLHYKSDEALVSAVRAHAATLGGRVEVHHADEHHLFHLFSVADAHISQTSTTTLEAEAFGVPNLIIGEVGGEWYRDEIAAGAYSFASTAAEILDFVKLPRNGARQASGAMVTDASAAESLLDELQLVA